MVKQEKSRARGVLLIAALLLVTVIGGMLVGGSATAQPGDPYTSKPPKSPKTSIHPSTTTTPPPPRTTTPPPTVLNRCIGCEDDVLPITGADLTLFIVTGFAAIATGVVIVRRTRARKQPTEV